MENIQNLESQVRELSKKCELESVQHEELSLEIQSLQRSQVKSFWNAPTSQNSSAPSAEIALEKSNHSAMEAKVETIPSTASLPIGSSISSTSSSIASPIGSTLTSSTHTANAPPQGREHNVTAPVVSSVYQQNATAKYLVERASENAPRANSPSSQMVGGAPLEATTTEIDRILARIEQDNRILAELEKSRTTVDFPFFTANVERLKATLEEETETGKEVIQSSTMKQSVTIQELEKLMDKLEQDNRILAELDKKRNVHDSQSSMFSSNPGTDGGLASHFGPSPSPSLGSLRDQSLVSTSSLHHSHVPSNPPPLFPSYQGSGVNGALSEEEMLDSIDFIELPGRGRCNIYCARYTYDPLKQSPNENPEAELCLNAGDYVIIYGEMDEDGFFSGELLDGRKGLVPSNFVEKLTGEELFDFHATVLYGNRDSDDSSVSFSYAQDMEMNTSDDFLLPEDFHRMNDYVDLDDVEELDEDRLSEAEKGNEGFMRGVPPPQRLILERQLNKSLLIGWVPPEVPSGMIEAYHVYVDGFPKATVKSTERTRALIEGVDSSRPHRISIRSVSSAGYHSKDAACTIVVGKDFPLAPTCVKASHIAATSALISWLPSNSNFQHVVAVNSVEVKVVKPGYFRHTVTGLSPNTLYRVSIRVRPGKLLYNDEKNPKKLEMLISNVEFKTLPKGLPDPPVNVQVEQGPQDGTLLVTWLPVPTHPVSPLVSPVTGYTVFAAGRKVADVDSPSGDHALIDGGQLLTTNKKCITVRSKSTDGLSTDSLVCIVPNDLLRSIQKSLILSARMHDERTPRERRSSSSDSESDTEITELLNHVNRRARAFDPMDSPFSTAKGDLTEDVPIEGRSELSDIVEEEEDTQMDTGEMKPRMQMNKMENSNHTHENEFDDYDPEEDRIEDRMCQDEPGKAFSSVSPSHRQSNQQPTPSPVPSQRRQGWKEQSYSSRSRESNVPPSHRHQQKERRNSSGQVILDPDENLSDKEIYPSPHITIPSIEITKDNVVADDCNEMDVYSEEDYNPGSRSNHRNSPDDYNTSPPHHRQPRTRSEPMMHQVSHSRPSFHGESPHNPQARGTQVHRHQEQQRQLQRRSPHHRNSDPTLSRTQPPMPTSNKGPQSHPGAHSPFHKPSHCPPEQSQPRPYNRSGPRVQPPVQHGHRGGHIASSHNSNPGFCDKRRGTGIDPPPRQRMMDFHDPMPKYEDEMGYDSFADQIGDIGDNRVRYFVALFDYDPQTMSPNPDAADEELPFQEGQLIKIYGDKDPDGFYRGESNGQIGLVPGNMVSEVQVEDEPFEREVLNDNISGRPRTLRTLPTNDRDPDSNWSAKQVRKMVAIYDYDPQEGSPNVDSEASPSMELAFNVGDVIYVIGDVDEDGFYVGELNSIKGLVPSNFLREMPLDEEEKSFGTVSRPKGAREDFQYSRNPPNSGGYPRDLTRAPKKPHYSHTSNHKEQPLSSYVTSTATWDDEEFEKEPPSRGPQVPPRALRLSHNPPFSGHAPSDQHW